jgi:methionine synthase II (cobalamin-independent)
MIKPECRATAIGSFPQDNAADALALIQECLPAIPVWPQLPNVSFNEGMCPQCSEGIPGVEIAAAERRIWVDTSADFFGGIEKFYELFLAEDPELFAISPGFSAGVHAFLETMKNECAGAFAVKGHVTGPVTWGLTVPDENKRATYYNEHLKDVIVKCIARKAQWQVALLKVLNPNVIIFVDEPYLQSIGSSTIALQREDVKEKVDEVLDTIIAAGATPGIHCCGNTDWGFISQTATQILNFDAYEFGETIALYPKEIAAYIERGGIIAWGIVPSSEKVLSENADSIIKKFHVAADRLVTQGISKNTLLEQALITPSCGVGSLPIPVAECVMRLLKQVTDKMSGKV